MSASSAALYTGLSSRPEIGSNDYAISSPQLDLSRALRMHLCSCLEVIYIDNMFFTGLDQVKINELMEAMGKEFIVRDLGELDYFLGIWVCQCENHIFLVQQLYLVNLLRSSSLDNLHPTPSPMDVKLDLSPEQTIDNSPEYHRILALPGAHVTRDHLHCKQVVIVRSEPTSSPLVYLEAGLMLSMWIANTRNSIVLCSNHVFTMRSLTT